MATGREVQSFVQEWMRENIQNETYLDEENEDPRPKQYAEWCIASAAAAGITRAEVEREYPFLSNDMAQAIEQWVDREIDRRMKEED